jgi:hypothetical protein
VVGARSTLIEEVARYDPLCGGIQISRESVRGRQWRCERCARLVTAFLTLAATLTCYKRLAT